MTHYKKVIFAETQEGIDAYEALLAMAADIGFHTNSSYNANAERYPDNVMSFVEKHMEYLRAHPTTNPQHYLSNLRLMTRVK